MRSFPLVLVIFAMGVGSARAEVFGGVDFPDGAFSFADEVVTYLPVLDSFGCNNPTGCPSEPHRNADTALAPPDFDDRVVCDATCTFVSLGSGGEIILRFTDNFLAPGGTAEEDLWIFEVGGDVEDTFVFISLDGLTWRSAGAVGGATSGIDLDALGFDPTEVFFYVRLVDDPREGGVIGITTGADIDAVGAIAGGVIANEVTSWSRLRAMFD